MAGVGVNDSEEVSSMTVDFCEKQASNSAQNFLHNFRAFDRKNPVSGRTRDPYDYAKKFTEFFLRYFEYELGRLPSSSTNFITEVNSLTESHASSQPDIASRESRLGGDIVPQNGNEHQHSHSQHPQSDDYERDSSPDRGISPSRKPSRGILRRFSFKSIKKSKLFKQGISADEFGEPSSPNSRIKHKNKKRGYNSQSQDIHREGIVNVLTGEDAKGKSKWEKTRLVLLKNQSGFQMEFYAPPKVRN